ncbi:MAG TPA: hypothetical protein VGI78_02675 [Acetobacteraceae bacterium]|jgi:hypothetical protein
MPGFLTAASVLMCPHGGTVQIVPSNTDVMFDGAPAVRASDTFIVAGCPFVIGVVPSPCVTVQWVQPAMQSTVGSNPTLTEASVGMCLAATQAPQGPVVIASTQPNVSGM